MPWEYLTGPPPTTRELQEEIVALQAWWRTLNARIRVLEKLDRRPGWTRLWDSGRRWVMRRYQHE